VEPDHAKRAGVAMFFGIRRFVPVLGLVAAMLAGQATAQDALESRLSALLGQERIMNRVDSASYPNSLCGVINQGTGRKYACQFTYTCDGKPENISEPASWERVGKVARLMIDGTARNLTSGATHYHTTAVNPRWARVFPRTARYGVHIFYRQPTRSASN